MKLIITRHGETEENKADIMQGHLPGRLSLVGRKQAKKVALRLKNEKIDFIFSSDLTRASDTAKEIAKFHPKTPITFVKELRERNLGEFQGKKKNEFHNDPSRGVEPMEKMYTSLFEVVFGIGSAKAFVYLNNGIWKAYGRLK